MCSHKQYRNLTIVNPIQIYTPMKKNITRIILLCLLSISWAGLSAQGLENFANFPETTNTYKDGSFQGQDGSTWNYYQCRGDSAINAPTPTLGKNRTPTSEVTSGQMANGIGTLSFDFKQVFSTSVALDVKVNGVLITTVTTNGEQGIVKNTGNIQVNVSGTFTLTFIQSSTSAGQVAIDNVTWTAFGGGNPDPEPTNYPSGLAASGNGLGVKATWTDATGTQLPAGYLLKISANDDITAPVDGTFEGDDLNLADGKGCKNIQQGVQQYSFSGLNSATTYYLKLFPYSNAGSIVDYKTDGTAPSTTGRTQAILYEQTFENGLAPWTQFSVLGEQTWVLDSIHGVNGSKCMKMTGYVSSTQTVANDDWLISPSMNIPGGSSPKLEFFSAMNYGTGANGITALITTDYESGDPSVNGTWTELPVNPTFSPGGWAWTSSGYSDLSLYIGPNVHIAFQYTCGESDAPTWEFDNIRVTVNSGVGFEDNSPAFSSLIYPNPCTAGFTAQTKGSDNYRMAIYSITGSKVSEMILASQKEVVSTSAFKPGIYMVEFISLNTGTREIHKLIIR